MADASCGAKAVGLARLMAAGLPVPDGFVVDRDGFAEIAGIEPAGPDDIGHALAASGRRIAAAVIGAELDAEVRARAVALGRLAVRSSASLEDGEHGAAAGVFASVTDVAPDDVWAAIRAVWTSALTPLAAAYARRRDAPLALAVIVQRFVPGERTTVYTRPVGEPAGDVVWLARGDALERVARGAAGDSPEVQAALAAEVAIGASGGADVELVREETPSGPRVWVVQARPIMHPARRRRSPPPPILLAPLVRDGRRWTWDIAHNPDPLSPAQAGLVAEVDRAGASPYAMRVCAGYLYTTAREPMPTPPPPVDRQQLATRLAEIEARLMLGEPADLADAVARYVAFTRIWAYELSPLVAAARGRLIDRLAREGHPAERLPALAAALIGPRKVPRDPVMSPAWDVAVATFAERTASAASSAGPRRSTASDERQRPAVARKDATRVSAPTAHQAHAVPPGVGPHDAAKAGAAPREGRAGGAVSPDLAHELAGEVELARAAAAAAEHDDVWFARAQWLVRRAFLVRAAELGLREDDIFWLPFDDVIRGRAFEPDDAHRLASAARAAHARTAEWQPPLVIHGDELEADLQQAATLRGVGVGPRVVGRVVRFASLASPPVVGSGDVVVARAITPALAMLVDGCVALVSETGGLLDHGAALARELGITCVVGCRGAWTQLDDGALVAVDGDAGLVASVAVGSSTRTTTET